MLYCGEVSLRCGVVSRPCPLYESKDVREAGRSGVWAYPQRLCKPLAALFCALKAHGVKGQGIALGIGNVCFSEP